VNGESYPGGASDPTNEELVELHAALVLGADPTVPAKLAELLVDPLRRRFRRFRALDWDTVDSTIGLSIARYLREPSRFDPERGGLLPFLWQDIQGDLLNEVERRTVPVADHHVWEASGSRRRQRREIPNSDELEVERDRRNPPVDEEVLDAIDPFDMPPALVERARAELGRFDQRDQALLELLGGGTRETTPYAEVLGISHLDVDTQRREVKRHKDRLKARLEVIRAKLTAPR
jgi:hypothetical protein